MSIKPYSTNNDLKQIYTISVNMNTPLRLLVLVICLTTAAFPMDDNEDMNDYRGLV